jgi:co-chaperonin GroES (HSP10)
MALAELIEPAPGRLAVLVKSAEEMRGGLYIPIDHARSLHEAKPVQGTIVAMGEEQLDDDDFDLKVGDLIIFGKYSGTEVRYRPPIEEERGTPAYAQAPRPPEERIVILTRKDVLARVRDKAQADNLTVKG